MAIGITCLVDTISEIAESLSEMTLLVDTSVIVIIIFKNSHASEGR